MSNHTPGPWFCAGPPFGNALPRYTSVIVTEWQNEDGEVLPICEMPFRHRNDENEANARLIAAAPDLLDALRMVLDDPDALDGRPRTYQCVRAAIAKAEGEVIP